MSRALFQIGPLSCPGCGKQIENKLTEQDGIISVKVLARLGRIRIEFDNTKINIALISDMLASLGYDAKIKKIDEDS